MGGDYGKVRGKWVRTHVDGNSSGPISKAAEIGGSNERPEMSQLESQIKL